MNSTPKFTLEILADSKEIKQFYSTRVNIHDDSGVDLFVPQHTKVVFGTTCFLDHGIKCRMVDDNGKTYPYYLYPRSSISKTPLILANSVGIIDRNYRGNIIASLKYVISDIKSFNQNLDYEEDYQLPRYEIGKGTRLVQICAPDLSPLSVRLVDSLDETSRGEGGFGSTGK